MFWNKKSEKPAGRKTPAAAPKPKAPRILTAEGWNRLAKNKLATKK